MRENLIWDIQMALLDKKFKNGLTSYTQSNCQVTLTDKGYRIYRPPNVNPTDHGNTMWGGLKLQFIDKLTKGHTYVIMFDVEGQSSNDIANIGFTNLMGWSGGGLVPTPSNIKTQNIFPSFNGKRLCFYKFTINDDLYKVCTSAYSSFVVGQTYPSYKDFQFGFGYRDTGSLGTDLYLSNFRLYDITTEEQMGMFKNGNVSFIEFMEKSNLSLATIYSTGTVCIEDIIEI